jgi:proline iminopeptidase
MFKKFSGLILGLLAIGLVSSVFGIGISLWVAHYFNTPIWFLAAGAAFYVITFMLGTKFLFKRMKSANHRVHKIAAASVGLLLMAAIALSLLLPLSDAQRKPTFVEGQQFWNLPSGLRIAYVRSPGNVDKPLPPVIFIHGGPGMPDMYGDSSFFGQLAQEGYDVYTYDQIGSGFSSRLKDPRNYTIQRDVEDLELIRQKIGSEKVILIGHSYGGEIAAHYIAKYGEHVEKVVFSSPGSIDPKDASGGNITSRLTSLERSALFKKLLYPRVLMAYGLLQVNPLAAMNFASDNEMDARNDIVYKCTQPALHSRGLPLGPQLSGLGFYANQTPQSASAKSKPDVRKALSERNTLALIIKGSSDYLSWSSAIDYKQALSNSSLIYFSGAGHNAYQDVPQPFMEVLRAFLNDKSLPVTTYNKLEPPADYEGVK